MHAIMCENVKLIIYCMKKIVSLFIALSMFVGANSATEHSGKISKASATTNHPTELKTMQKELRSADARHLEIMKAGKPVTRPAAKKANKATATTITIESNNLAFEYSWGYPSLYGGDDDYEVSVYFNTNQFYGKYVNNDGGIEIYLFDADYNYVELSYTVAEYKATAKGDQFTASGVGDDGNNYEINLTFFGPDKANDTIRHTFAAGEGDAYPDYNVYVAYAVDDDFECQLALNGLVPTSDKGGVNRYAEFTYVQTIDGTDTTYVGAAYTAEVLITETPTSYTFEVSYFAEDSNLYIMTIPVTKIAPVDTVTYTFAADRTISVLYYGTSGDYYIKAKDANAIVILDIFSDDSFVGHWKAADGVFDYYYTNAYLIDGTDTTQLVYRDVEVIAVENKDDYDITANFFAKNDNKVYSFKTNYVKPVAKDTVEYTLVDYQFIDFREYDGTYDILAAPADSSIVFQMEFVFDEQFAGTYSLQQMVGAYTWVKIGKNYFSIANAQFAITGTDEDNLYVVGQMLAENNTLYKLTIGSQTTAIEKVENAKALQPMKVIRNGQVLILKDGQYYNLLGTKID